jgi:hypothetical protein
MKHRACTLVIAAALGGLPSVALADNERPMGFSTGIGAGWDFPTQLDDINVASLRFRLASGLTIEPRVELSLASDTDDVGGTEQENKSSAFGLAAEARWPLMGRGPVDFLVTGGAVIDYFKDNPDGNDNNTTTSLLALFYGLSVEYWFGPHWVFSLTGSNPIFVRAKTTNQEPPPTDETSSTTTSFGAVFNPDIIGMLHIFY